jgi:hypothetical protein
MQWILNPAVRSTSAEVDVQRLSGNGVQALETILRGALQLGVMVSGLNTDPARDVRPSHSKNQHKGPVTLTTDQRLELSVNLQTSESCREPRQVDPITLLVATALRMLRTARVPKPPPPPRPASDADTTPVDETDRSAGGARIRDPRIQLGRVSAVPTESCYTLCNKGFRRIACR